MLPELKEENLSNVFGKSDPENSTALRQTHSLFPVLLFPNKYSKKRPALEKDTITSELPPKESDLSKMNTDEGICAADNNEILDSADEKTHECAIGRKTLKQTLHFTTHKHTRMVEKLVKIFIRWKQIY